MGRAETSKPVRGTADESRQSYGRLSREFRDRTKRFAASVIRLYAQLPRQGEAVRVCGSQMLRAGTSVAAQVREASRARSDSEFTSKLGGALQETDETQLWPELLQEECGVNGDAITAVKKEAGELMVILTTMIHRTRQRLERSGEKAPPAAA